MTLLPAIINRRAVRAYKADPVSDEQIAEIIRAAQFAPTAHGKAPLEFLVVRDPETKQRLFTLLEQEFLKEAPVLIVPVVAEGASVAPMQDLSVATENIFLQAAALGLGTVWKNLYDSNRDAAREILGIPEKYFLINIIPVGFPAEKPAPHTDANFNANKIHWGKW
jgi:nitroreductase